MHRIEEAARIEICFMKNASGGQRYADLGADKFGRVGGRWPPLWMTADWSNTPDPESDDEYEAYMRQSLQMSDPGDLGGSYAL